MSESKKKDFKIEDFQNKCEYIIEKLGYNRRQTADVLGIARQSVDKKLKGENKNGFNENDLKKFKKYIEDLHLEIKDL